VQTSGRSGGLAVTGEAIDLMDPAETRSEVPERGLWVELRVVRAREEDNVAAAEP
jgi:hypothetical protein